VSDGRPSVERDRHGRRVLERDRHGTTVAALTWADDDRLVEAAVRIPDGTWLRVRPGAAHDPRWGATDVISMAGSPLTQADIPLTGFAAVEWAAIDAIPPLAEPARLPPGGGTAVLNLVAALAVDQARGPLAYRGPYPTEQLFLALLESFAFAPDGPSDSMGAEHPLELFMGGGLVWIPRPHERTFDPRGVYVQTRERVEKLVWRGRAYYRDVWQGVERHAVHRLRDDGERVVGALWALGGPIEDHVVLSRAGDVLEIHAPAAAAEPSCPLAPATAAGLVAIVVAASAPPLAAAIRAVAGGLVFEWAPLDGDLAALDDGRARVSTALRRVLAVRLATAGSRAEQVRLGFAALAEAAHALGDALRARGQARLAAVDAGAQAEALARSSTDAAAAAREIGEGVERLLVETAQLRA
jgi:hypothetical protein